jgi:hypothetical protein
MRAYSARAERIGNGLFQAMQLTDFKIGDGTGLIAANLKSHHHKIRILQRSSLLAMAANFTVGADGIHQLTHHNMRLFQRVASISISATCADFNAGR